MCLIFSPTENCLLQLVCSQAYSKISLDLLDFTLSHFLGPRIFFGGVPRDNFIFRRCVINFGRSRDLNQYALCVIFDIAISSYKLNLFDISMEPHNFDRCISCVLSDQNLRVGPPCCRRKRQPDLVYLSDTIDVIN